MQNTLQEYNRESAYLVFVIDSGFLCRESVFPLVHMLDLNGFHPSPGVGNEPMYRAPDIDSLIVDRFRNFEEEGIDTGDLLRIFSCRMMLAGFPPGNPNSSFSWSVYRDVGGKEIPLITITAQIHTIPGEQEEQFLHLASKLYFIGKKIYENVRPKYGFISNPDVERPDHEDPTPQHHQIDALCWVNFFGPGYSRTYSRELLCQIPGYYAEELDDGGVLYQSRNSIRVENELQHRRWQREAQRYLAPHGISIDFDTNFDID